MAVGTVSGIDPQDNWQLVASQAMSGLTTYTFSSLSSYKTYWLVGKGLTNGTADIVGIRFNGDTSANSYGNIWAATNNLAYFLISPSVTSAKACSLKISDADKSIPHKVESTMLGYQNPSSNGDAYTDPTPITSITVNAYSGNAFNGGTVYLYGIAA